MILVVLCCLLSIIFNISLVLFSNISPTAEVCGVIECGIGGLSGLLKLVALGENVDLEHEKIGYILKLCTVIHFQDYMMRYDISKFLEAK